MERISTQPVNNQERNAMLAVVDSAINLTNPSDLSQIGGKEDLVFLSTQVSTMIANYNYKHPNEMLPKSPEAVLETFMSGNSVMIVGKYGGELTALWHGAYYPNFGDGEETTLGIQVVEHGSQISHPDFRGGFGLGTRGNEVRYNVAQRRWPKVLGIATNKQIITPRVWAKKTPMRPANFWDYPYLTYLTCTCTNCSETHGFNGCVYRRSLEMSDQPNFDAILDRSNPIGSMPCTLIVSDTELAHEFELVCQTEHQRRGGEPLIPGSITIDTMQRAGEFFDSLKN